MTRSLLGGYTGKVLGVDLTDERVSEEDLDAVTLRKYMGGSALGAKYLLEEAWKGGR